MGGDSPEAVVPRLVDLTSGTVNAHLAELFGGVMTANDFRTYIDPRIIDLYEAGSTIGQVARHSYGTPDRRQAALEKAVLVAPGPIWTPLQPATRDADDIAKFGSDAPLGRAGQPAEVAPAYVFLASQRDASYVSGTILGVTGGKATL